MHNFTYRCVLTILTLICGFYFISKWVYLVISKRNTFQCFKNLIGNFIILFYLSDFSIGFVNKNFVDLLYNSLFAFVTQYFIFHETFFIKTKHKAVDLKYRIIFSSEQFYNYFKFSLVTFICVFIHLCSSSIKYLIFFRILLS